jgi:hypothetical protein
MILYMRSWSPAYREIHRRQHIERKEQQRRFDDLMLFWSAMMTPFFKAKS